MIAYLPGSDDVKGEEAAETVIRIESETFERCGFSPFHAKLTFPYSY